MTLTWRRLGYLGFMIPLAFWALSSILFGVTHFNAMRVAFILAAITVWVVGSRLNAEDVDDDGKAPHLTFGAPMQFAVWVPAAALVLTFL
jgi:hypothetical protein